MSPQPVLGLMRCLATQGDWPAALLAGREHQRLIHAELGVSADGEVLRLVERLQSGERPTPAEFVDMPGRPDVTQKELPSHGPEGPPQPSGAIPDRRTLHSGPARIAIGALVVALVLGLGAALIAGRAGAGGALVRDRVAVAILENHTGDSTLGAFGIMAADWITRGLAQTGLVDVLDPSILYIQGEDSAGHPTEPLRFARTNGAALVLAGRYYLAQDTIEIDMRLLESSTGRLLQTLDPIVTPSMDTQGALTRVQERAMAAVAVQTDQELQQITSLSLRPPAYAAYREFITGFHRYWSGYAGNALVHFLGATELDPEFLPAAVWVAVAQDLRKGHKCKAVDSIATALSATRNRLGELDQLVLRRQEATCRGDREEVLRLAKQGLALQPKSSYGQFLVGMYAHRAGRHAESAAILRGLDTRRDLGFLTEPGKPDYWGYQLANYHALGDYRRELSDALRWNRESGPRLLSRFYVARALAALGRYDEAVEQARLMAGMPPDSALWGGPPTPGIAIYHLARELLSHGSSIAAEEAIALAIDWYRKRPESVLPSPEDRMAFVRSLAIQGEYSSADSVCVLLLQAAADDFDCTVERGLIAAARRDTRRVQATIQWLDAPHAWLHPWEALYAEAQLTAALGDGSRALDLLSESVQRGLEVSSIYGPSLHDDLPFAALRRHPRFKELVRPRE